MRLHSLGFVCYVIAFAKRTLATPYHASLSLCAHFYTIASLSHRLRDHVYITLEPHPTQTHSHAMVSSSWLTKQRKAVLIDLAEQAGLQLYAGL